MIVALLVAILLVQLVGFVCARLEAHRLVHAALARTPAEFQYLLKGHDGTMNP